MTLLLFLTEITECHLNCTDSFRSSSNYYPVVFKVVFMTLRFSFYLLLLGDLIGSWHPGKVVHVVRVLTLWYSSSFLPRFLYYLHDTDSSKALLTVCGHVYRSFEPLVVRPIYGCLDVDLYTVSLKFFGLLFSFITFFVSFFCGMDISWSLYLMSPIE